MPNSGADEFNVHPTPYFEGRMWTFFFWMTCFITTHTLSHTHTHSLSLSHSHTLSLTLSLSHTGPNSNSSQFFITLKVAANLDGQHVVFGHVLEGYEAVVKAIEKVRVLNVNNNFHM